jgi:NAD(P)-dependent dehydrogenase (short-subunit alcohol dehydrogenase family)
MGDRNMFDLTGRVAIVTGGGFGIGRSICEVMAEFGADVVIADINEELARETAQIIAQYGHRAMAIKTDVSVSSDVQSMVDETVSKWGRIDILFNNAGVLMGQSLKLHEYPEELWDKTMAINLKGVFLCTKAVLPVMLKQQKGSIINTASVGGILPGDRNLGSVVYDVTKGAIATLTRKTAAEYGRDGIRMNAIAPGFLTGTNFAFDRRSQRSTEESAKIMQIYMDRSALGRYGRPDELKGIAVYLASDASSFATGQVFVVDAGVS